jgi:guanyl-specific ribonuclease Sa
MYFNRKYQRNGALIANRYKSIPVEADEYFIQETFEVSGKTNMGDEQIRRKILRCTGGREPHDIASWSKVERDGLIRSVKGRW